MRSERWIPALLALIIFGSLPWRVHGYFPGGNESNDASIYILCAQSLLQGDGYTYLGEPFSVRPPGFSLLIAPVLAWRGVDFLALQTLVAVLGGLAVMAFFYWLRLRTSTAVAATWALALHFSPGWTEWSSQVMTDVPGVLALVCGLLLDRWARAKPCLQRDALLGAFLGLSAYLRSTQLILLAAIVLARLWNRTPGRMRSAATLIAAALIIIGPWMVRDSMVRTDDPAMQNFVHSYSTGMFHEDAGDPGSAPRDWGRVLTRTAPERLGMLTAGLGSLLGSNSETLWTMAGGVLLLVALGWRLWRDRDAAWIFALLYMAVLLVYFGWRTRLMLPLLPLGFAALALSLPRRHIQIALGLVVLVAGMLISSATAEREDLRELDRRRTAQLSAWKQVLPPGARCAALIGWHHSVGLGVPVYSLYFALRRGKALDELLAEERIAFILVGPDPGEQAMLAQLRQRFGPGQPAGAGWVFAVGGR